MLHGDCRLAWLSPGRPGLAVRGKGMAERSGHRRATRVRFVMSVISTLSGRYVSVLAD